MRDRIRFEWKYQAIRLKEKLLIKIAWAVPKSVAYWCFVRVFSHATLVHSDLTPDEVTYSQASKAWGM